MTMQVPCGIQAARHVAQVQAELIGPHYRYISSTSDGQMLTQSQGENIAAQNQTTHLTHQSFSKQKTRRETQLKGPKCTTHSYL